MWRNAGYENKLVWVIITIVMLVVAGGAVWLYQANLVTFGLRNLNAAGCPGNEAAIKPLNGNKWDKKCVKYKGGEVDCSGIENSFYETPDGYGGTCFNGTELPTVN